MHAIFSQLEQRENVVRRRLPHLLNHREQGNSLFGEILSTDTLAMLLAYLFECLHLLHLVFCILFKFIQEFLALLKYSLLM